MSKILALDPMKIKPNKSVQAFLPNDFVVEATPEVTQYDSSEEARNALENGEDDFIAGWNTFCAQRAKGVLTSRIGAVKTERNKDETLEDYKTRLVADLEEARVKGLEAAKAWIFSPRGDGTPKISATAEMLSVATNAEMSDAEKLKLLMEKLTTLQANRKKK